MSSLEEIRALEPRAVFGHFADILSIPHPSFHEEKVADYLLSFASTRGFDAHKDSVGNVIMQVPATSGKEKAPRVILQAHMDMVPVAAAGVDHDFLTKPIDAYIDNGWIKARGTTLGADDGLGESVILALIGDTSVAHGPITAIFTVEEEVTMKGANGLDPKELQGDYLINLDSEEDGTLCVSCAGSCDINFSFGVDRVEAPDTSAMDITLKDCTGGHSGADIHKGHCNSVIVLCRILATLEEQFELFVEDLHAGFVRNAVPSSAKCRVRVPFESEQDFTEAFNSISEKYLELYSNTDPDARFVIEPVESKGQVLSLEDSEILLRFISTLPNGVFRLWSEDMTIPETSSNLGLVRSFEDRIEICAMPRSLKEDGLDEIISALTAAGELAGCEISAEHRHPCWSSPASNALIDELQKSYQQVTGKSFTVLAMHAGLECAQFCKAAPHLQLVSLGSTLLAPHSPDERCLIKGVGELYDTLKLTLSSL